LYNNIIQGEVNKELSDYIYNTIISDNFGWYWNELQINPNKLVDQISGFTHVFYKKDGFVNSAFNVVIPYLLDELKNVIDVDHVVRGQANLLCNINVSEEENINSLHTDSPDDNTFSILYYVITSDGNTVIYNKEGSNIKVSPIKGNYVIFPSNLLHKASPPKDNKRRVVINIIVKGKLKK
jgi:hypothetical protein